MKILWLILVQNVLSDYYTDESSYNMTYHLSDTYVPAAQMPDHSGCYGFVTKDSWDEIAKYLSTLKKINFKEFLNSFTISDDFTIPDEYLTIVDQINFIFKTYEGREDYLKYAVYRKENIGSWYSDYQQECYTSDHMHDISTALIQALHEFANARTNDLAVKVLFNYGKKLNIALGFRKYLANRQIDFIVKCWNYFMRFKSLYDVSKVLSKT